MRNALSQFTFLTYGQSLEPNDPTLYECIVRIEEVLNATLMMKN